MSLFHPQDSYSLSCILPFPSALVSPPNSSCNDATFRSTLRKDNARNVAAYKIQALWAVLCGGKCTKFGRCKTCGRLTPACSKSLEALRLYCCWRYFLVCSHCLAGSSVLQSEEGEVALCWCVWPGPAADRGSGAAWCPWHQRAGQKDHPRAQTLLSTSRDTPQTSATVLLSAQSQLEAEYSCKCPSVNADEAFPHLDRPFKRRTLTESEDTCCGTNRASSGVLSTEEHVHRGLRQLCTSSRLSTPE